MSEIYFYSLTSVFVVSLLSFIGVLSLAVKPELLKKITMYLVSLSAGTLLGSSFFDLLPEITKQDNIGVNVWISILSGMIIFFILEKFVCWRHCHIPTSSEHPHDLGVMNLVGDGLHNFIDGAVIAGSFMVNPQLGLATTIAVITHEIPQEIGDFGVLIHAGYKRSRALFLNFLIALTALIGALAALEIGSKIAHLTNFLLPFTVGGFIYIATADLIPELKKEVRPLNSLIQLAFIILGLGLTYGLKYFFIE